ncbi:MAG: alpha/beta fold hydrolase [Anaerolineales bacterium]
MAQHQIIETAEPFFFPGGPVGCVLVHGFTGTPKEMRFLGEYLNQKGYTVVGVRLAGHATNLSDIIRTRKEDWLASVEDGYYLLKAHCEKEFLIGLSMGGVLSLIQAANLPVEGVVAMSTPYDFPVRWAAKVPWVMRLMSIVMPTRNKSQGAPWFKPELREDHISYPKHPVRSAYELSRLLRLLRDTLPEVKVPALIIHSSDDDYVVSEHAKKIFVALGSSDKELLWVDHARHVITRDGDTTRVFDPIHEFIQKHINKY